jgi:hypothetical protein
MKYKTYLIEKRPLPGADFKINALGQVVPCKPKKHELEYWVHDTKDPAFRFMALSLEEARREIDFYRAIELRALSGVAA